LKSVPIQKYWAIDGRRESGRTLTTTALCDRCQYYLPLLDNLSIQERRRSMTPDRDRLLKSGLSIANPRCEACPASGICACSCPLSDRPLMALVYILPVVINR